MNRDDWRLIKLGECIKEISKRNRDNNEKVPVLSVTNTRGFVISEEFFDRKIFSKDLDNYKIVQECQFAYNPSRVNVGSIARLKEYKKGLLSPMYVVFETKENLNSSYLEHWISSQHFRNLVKANTQGTVRDSLNFSALREFPFEYPPLTEQYKIAEILSSVDAVIEKIQAIIDQTQVLKKGLMQELFTRGIPGRHKKFKKTEIGEIPEAWEIVKMRMLASIRYGLGQPPQISVNGIPMIRATDIKQGRINVSNVMRVEKSTIPKSKDVYLKSGDVLIVRSGVYTGDVGYINQTLDGFIAGYDLIVRPSRSLNGKYLFYYLLSPMVQEGHFKNNKSRSAQPHLNAKEVGLTKIILPSIFEQERIAEILTSIDDRIEIEINRISQLLTLKSALMQVLLTGEIRVKV